MRCLMQQVTMGQHNNNPLGTTGSTRRVHNDCQVVTGEFWKSSTVVVVLVVVVVVTVPCCCCCNNNRSSQK
jgi:hypothetical protein